MHPDTLTVHGYRRVAGEGPMPPIHQAAPFRFPSSKAGGEMANAIAPTRFYHRWGNPTTRALEETVARLEGGECALATSSGMGAISTLMLHHAAPHRDIVAQRELYTATAEMVHETLPRLGLPTRTVAAADDEGWKEAITRDTALVFVETPSNPAMAVADLHLVADLAADVDAPLAVDNTFASPLNQHPLDLGADFAVHSATKFLGGHSDTLGGIIVGHEHEIGEVWRLLTQTGAILAPNDAFLILRGIKTLALRIERHNSNALRIAEFLETHPQVKRVNYPGLASFPRHKVASLQMTGYGGMLSFEIDGGADAAKRFVESLEVFMLGVSLGGVDSLIQHPASMMQAPLASDTREAMGITPGLVRVSVGIEHADDLIADLGRGFERAAVDEPRATTRSSPT